MFLLDRCSFYERKTRHLEKYVLCEHMRVQGIFGLSSTQNHLNTQHTRKRVSKWSPSSTRLLMPTPNKATEQVCFYCPCKLTSDSDTKRRHHDIADSRTPLLLTLLIWRIFDFMLLKLTDPKLQNPLFFYNCIRTEKTTMAKASKAWFIYTAPNHKFVSGGLQIMVHYVQ